MRKARLGLVTTTAISGLLMSWLLFGVTSSTAGTTTNRFSIVTSPGLIPAYSPKIQTTRSAARATRQPRSRPRDRERWSSAVRPSPAQ